jgi:hypothetical protein
LTDTVETKLGDFQVGFRPDQSTVDNIHIVKQMYEKCYEYHIAMYSISVDFKQAFCGVNRRARYKSLKEYDVPLQLIQLIKIILKVKYRNEKKRLFSNFI